MKNLRDMGNALVELRKKAEDLLRGRNEALPEDMAPQHLRFVIQELRTHQIELELQNEELRRVQSELEESRDRYAELYDFAPVGYLTLNEEGAILGVNLTAADMLGVERRALLGSPISAHIVEEDQDTFFMFRRELLKTRLKRRCELRLRKKDGIPFWADMECTLVEKTEPDDRSFYSVIRDISERKRVQDALLKSEERFQQIADTAFEWIWEADADGWYTYASPVVEKILGYRPEEVVGKKHFYDLFHPDDRTGTRTAALEVLAGRAPFRNFLNRNMHKDGRTVWLLTSGIPILDEKGTFLGYRGADMDFTVVKQGQEEKTALERKLFEAQRVRSLGVLAGGVAHDFNNLLMGVMGNADLALFELSPGSPALERVHNIKATAVRLAELTRQMLAYSGKGKCIVEHMDISHVASEMASLLRVSISKKAAIQFDLKPGLPSIEADQTQVRQVIMNLITNASEAIGEKAGVIVLRTGMVVADGKYLSERFPGQDLPAGPYVFFEVSDSGCGMDEETIGKIFDPFFSTKFLGRGLGLAAVYGIVRGHGGGIMVCSEPNRGATFRALFPTADFIQPPLPADAAPVETKEVGGTILLVDDEEIVLSVAKEILERAGFAVLTAGDGREAMEQLRDHAEEISAVLLDLTMPHMDGMEAFEEIQALHPGIPIILSSGYNEEDAMGHFPGKALAGFIQKPYEAKHLIEKVGHALLG